MNDTHFVELISYLNSTGMCFWISAQKRCIGHNSLSGILCSNEYHCGPNLHLFDIISLKKFDSNFKLLESAVNTNENDLTTYVPDVFWFSSSCCSTSLACSSSTCITFKCLYFFAPPFAAKQVLAIMCLL